MNDHLSHRLIRPGGLGFAAWAVRLSGLRPTWISPGRVSDPVWSCTGRGLPGRRVTTTPVRSYRTFSPLPDRDSRVVAPSAVYFCGTFPRVSPGGRYPPSLPFGVRTFLEEFSLSPRPSDPQRSIVRARRTGIVSPGIVNGTEWSHAGRSERNYVESRWTCWVALCEPPGTL